MHGDEVQDGAAVLRAARLAAHMTQEQLAAMSGLNVRTVRGLETHHITRPRRQSVELIARALGLDASGRMRLMQAWGLVDYGPIDDASGSSADDGSIEIALARAGATLRSIAISESVYIDADRRLAWRRTEEVVLALEDGVEGRTIFYGADDDGMDPQGVYVRDLANCVAAREQSAQDGHWKLFNLDFGRPLTLGETHLFRYTTDFTQARCPGASTPTSGMEIGGFVAPPASYVLDVQFDARQVPVTCSQVFQPRPDAPLQTVAAIPTSRGPSFHLAIIGPKSGGHGLAWSW